jgi:hypothetical protein
VSLARDHPDWHLLVIEERPPIGEIRNVLGSSAKYRPTDKTGMNMEPLDAVAVIAPDPSRSRELHANPLGWLPASSITSEQRPSS